MDSWMDTHRLQFVGTWWMLALIGYGVVRGVRPRMSLPDQVKYMNENREGRKGKDIDPEAGYADPEMAMSTEDLDVRPEWMN